LIDQTSVQEGIEPVSDRAVLGDEGSGGFATPGECQRRLWGHASLGQRAGQTGAASRRARLRVTRADRRAGGAGRGSGLRRGGWPGRRVASCLGGTQGSAPHPGLAEGWEETTDTWASAGRGVRADSAPGWRALAWTASCAGTGLAPTGAQTAALAAALDLVLALAAARAHACVVGTAGSSRRGWAIRELPGGVHGSDRDLPRSSGLSVLQHRTHAMGV